MSVKVPNEDIEIKVWPHADGTWSFRVFIFIAGYGNSIVRRGHDRPSEAKAWEDAYAIADQHRETPA